MSTNPQQPDQSAEGLASEATTDFRPDALETSDHVPSSFAPITGKPVGDETSAYDPRLAQDMPASLEETRPQAPNQEITDADREFVVGAPARPNRYILRKFHAKGGMGEIWLAEDQEIGRAVALKRMRGGRSGNSEKFLFEAQVTGRLEHPGVVPVHELGFDEKGRPYYIMKFVHGLTLKETIKDFHSNTSASSEPREVQQLRLLEVFVSLCQTIAFAHSHGIIHRDIKPDNVMLGDYGETLVLDWGIAKVLGQPEGFDFFPSGSLSSAGESHETQMGTIKGTPSYFAPEMAEGLVGEIDQRSDVYLLGGTLYQILTGQRPRKGADLSQILNLARTQAPVPPRKLDPNIPRALEAICQKAMALKKEDRYESAQELAADVERYLAGEPVKAYLEPFLARAWRWARRHRRALGRGAAAALVLAIGGFAFAQINKAQKRALAFQQHARQLEEQDQAREGIKTFRRLADEARFYLANLNPVSENAPYYELDKGEKAARAALSIAEPWGATLEQLPLADEIPQLRTELYDLLLMLVGADSSQATGPESVSALTALLDRAQKMSGSSRGYYRLLAKCQQLAGNVQEAKQEEQRAADPNLSTSALDHFLLGEQYRTDASSQKNAPAKPSNWEPNRDLVAKAIEEYRLALKKDPEHYWSRYQLGRLYLSLNKWGEAVEAFSACIALRRESPWGYSGRANALALLKRFSDAEADLDWAIGMRSELRPLRLARGFVYLQQGKEKEALAEFAVVLELPKEKRLLEAAFYRGLLYLQRGEAGDAQRALADFNLVAMEKTDFYRVYHLRAMVNFILGNDDKGMKDLGSYISKGKAFDENSPDAHEQRGRLLRLLIPDLKKHVSRPALRGKAILAVAELQKAVKLGANSSQLYDDFGAVLQYARQVPLAIPVYSKGLELAPKDVKLLVKRGWAFAALKQYDKSRDDFAAVIRNHPDHAEAHAGLGYVHACRDKKAEAQREANLAMLHGAGDFLVLHNIACVFAELSETDASREKEFQDLAIDQLRRARELWSREDSSLDEIGLIEEDSAFREPLRARSDFQELLKRVKPKSKDN